MNDMISTEGRLNRAKYFRRWLAIALAASVLSILQGALLGITLGENAVPLAGIVGALIGVGAVALIAFQVIQRLHDLGRPNAHYFLLLVPFYDLYLSLLLFFKRGVQGSNQYGPDPLAQPA